MGGVVVRFERRVASLVVIRTLVEFGYLQPGACHRATYCRKGNQVPTMVDRRWPVRMPIG
jgi:hypothetical protein